MNSKEIEETIKRYNERLKDYGVTEKALGWGDKGRSRLRFKMLCSEWDFRNKTVLDYGCGFGDLYTYIKENYTEDFNYIGIDLNANLIDIAKSRGHENAAFYVISENPLEFFNQHNLKIDYILSSGIFNFKLENNLKYIAETLDVFNSLAKSGFASNFLSDKVDFKAKENYHANPGEILDLHYKYSNNIILKNNYMPFEFTVLVNKQEQVDKQYNVYNDFVKDI